MSVALVAETVAKMPLHLTIERESSGGASGLSPLVAIRDAFTPGSYLDWADSTFKLAGWTTKYAPLTMFDAGQYQRTLDLEPLNLKAQDVLVAEYKVADGSNDYVASDTIIIQTVGQDASLVRKAVTNRQEEFAGDPGRIMLFDDDGTTKILEQELRDGANNGVDLAIRVPAKRTGNILP